MLPQCSLKLQPPRMPKSGKKLYRGFFLRGMKEFTHIYWVDDGLYLVSVPTPLDPRVWIDNNFEKTIERKWNETEQYNVQATLF